MTVTAKEMVDSVRVVKVKDVTVSERFRKEIGDVSGLAASIEGPIGLLHFPVVDEKLNLLAGVRRFEAVKLLKWRELPVRIVKDADALGTEHDENELRKDFTLSERVAIADAIRARMGDGRTNREEEERPTGDYRQQAADRGGFDSASEFVRAKRVVSKGSKKLVKAMDDGTLRVASAAKVAELSKPQQDEVLRRVKGGEGIKDAIRAVTGHDAEDNGLGDAHEGGMEVEDDSERVVSVDALGGKIPHRLKDAFASRILAECRGQAGQVLKQLVGVARWNPYLPLADLRQYLKLVEALLAASVPHAVCPRCKAVEGKIDDCKECRGCGWMTENAYAEKVGVQA